MPKLAVISARISPVRPWAGAPRLSYRGFAFKMIVAQDKFLGYEGLFEFGNWDVQPDFCGESGEGERGSWSISIIFVSFIKKDIRRFFLTITTSSTSRVG